MRRGLAEHQSGVEQVQYRRYNRRYYRGDYRRLRRGYRYGGGPVLLRRYAPYAYAAPYPYYRPVTMRPARCLGIGPFGFGVW